MLKNILQFMIFTIILISSSVTAQNIQWVKKYTNLNAPDRGWDQAFHVHVLSDESLILTGTSTSGGDGTGQWTYFTKVNSDGSLNSNTFYGDTDPDHDFTAYEFHPIDYVTPGFILIGRSNKNGYDQILLIRLDQNMNIVWEKYIGSSAYQHTGYSVQRVGTTGFVIAGFRRANEIPTPAPDFYVALVDDNGNVTSEYTLDGGNNDVDVCRSVKVDNVNGGFVACGFTRKLDETYDMTILKFDASLNLQWTKNFGGTGGDFGENIIVTSDGYVVVGGTTVIREGETSSNLNAWMIKTDFSGNEVWSNSGFIDEWVAYGQSLIQLPSGNFVMVGVTQGSVDSLLTFLDVYVAEIQNTDGKMLWQRKYGEKRADYGYWVQRVDPGDQTNSDYVFCGTSFSWVDINTDTSNVFVARIGYDYVCGDVNNDNASSSNILDLTYLIDYIFRGGPPPPDWKKADVNDVTYNDGSCENPDYHKVNILDLNYLVAYIFHGGPPPMCPWCEHPS